MIQMHFPQIQQAPGPNFRKVEKFQSYKHLPYLLLV